MPEAVIPFQPNFKSFIITIFVMMIVVRLLFVILGGLSRQPWRWRRFSAWIKTAQLDGIRAPWINSAVNYASDILSLARGRNHSTAMVEGIEMDTLNV